METQEISNPIVFAVNNIAQLLGHGCALGDEEAAKVPTLRALQLGWKYKGAVQNDQLSSAQASLKYLEGWYEEVDAEGNLVALIHCPPIGRIRISAYSREIVLEFYADHPKDKIHGEAIRIIEISFRPGWPVGEPSYMEIRGQIHDDLILDQPDRLQLLWEIDFIAFNGEICKTIDRVCGYGKLGGVFQGFWLLKEAKLKLDQMVAGAVADRAKDFA